MKPKKDIFTLFRQSRHKLDEPPSRQAWQKLERRLDGHRNRGSFQLYRSLAMVAAVVALVAVLFGISIFLEQYGAKPDAVAEAVPVAMEELSYSESENDGFRTQVEFQKKYQSRFALSVSIDEGTPEKRLVAIRFVEGDLYEAEGDALTAEKEAAGSKMNISPPKARLAKPKRKIHMLEVEEMPNAGERENENQSLAKEKKRKGLALNTLKMNGQNKTDLLETEVAAFRWLVGQWKETFDLGVSYEQWVVKDEFTLEGKGYLMIDGKKTFTQGMKIQKTSKGLFYIVAVDASEKPVHFKLKTNTGQVAVFENENAFFPQQIILKTVLPPTQFTTIYQNGPIQEMRASQKNYLQKRNYLQDNNQKATRTLTRVTAN